MKKLLKGAVAAVFIVSLVLASCGGGSGPTAAAKAFFAAAEKNDSKAMEKVATKDTVALMAMFGEKSKTLFAEYGKIIKTSEEIDGDKATVTLTFDSGKSEELNLIKEDGKWKVSISK